MATDDEQDAKLLRQLQSCGCILPDKASSLADIPHNYVLPIVQKCIDVISGDEDTPIPDTKGEQVLLASKIASACKDFGYENELGYDLFLYPNEPDLRDVLLFLAGKISDKRRHSFSEASDGIAVLMQKISSKLQEELERPWFPSYCLPKALEVSSDGVWSRSERSYVEPFLSKPFVVTRGMKNMSEAFEKYWKSVVPDYENDTKIDQDDSLRRADEILDKLRLKNSMSSNFTSPTLNNNDSKSADEPKNETQSEEVDLDDLEINYLKDNDRRCKLLKYLSSLNEGDEKFEKVESKLLNIMTELKEGVKSKKNILNSLTQERVLTHEEKLEEEKLAALEKRIKLKTNKIKKMQKKKLQLFTMPDAERNLYANDVIETIDQLEKLKVGVANIISNINTTQKEINRINGVLDRSFVVADELIFKDAKKDEFARKTYKLIAGVHTECNELCNMVKEIGTFTRDTVALEKNIETAERKNTKENLERAVEDLRNLKMSQS